MSARWKVRVTAKWRAGTGFVTQRVPAWEGDHADIRGVYDLMDFPTLEAAYSAASIAAQVDLQEDREPVRMEGRVSLDGVTLHDVSLVSESLCGGRVLSIDGMDPAEWNARERARRELLRGIAGFGT